jgi:hypothetical protein
MPILVRVDDLWRLWKGPDSDTVVLGMGSRLLPYDGYVENVLFLDQFDQQSLSEQSRGLNLSPADPVISVSASVDGLSEEFEIHRDDLQEFQLGYLAMDELLVELNPRAQHTWLTVDLNNEPLSKFLTQGSKRQFNLKHWHVVTGLDSQYGELIRKYQQPWRRVFYCSSDSVNSQSSEYGSPVATSIPQPAEVLLGLLNSHPEGFWDMNSFGATNADKVKTLVAKCRPGRLERWVKILGTNIKVSFRTYQLLNDLRLQNISINLTTAKQWFLVQIRETFWFGSGTIEAYFGVLWSLRYSLDETFVVLWPPSGLESETNPANILAELMQRDYHRRHLPEEQNPHNPRSSGVLRLHGGITAQISPIFATRFSQGYYSGLSLIEQMNSLEQDSSSRRRRFQNQSISDRYSLLYDRNPLKAPVPLAKIRFNQVYADDPRAGPVILSFWAALYPLPIVEHHGPVMSGQVAEHIDQLTALIFKFRSIESTDLSDSTRLATSINSSTTEEQSFLVDRNDHSVDYINGLIYGARRYQMCIMNYGRYQLLKSEGSRDLKSFVDANSRDPYDETYFDAFLLNYPFYPVNDPRYQIVGHNIHLEIHYRDEFIEGVKTIIYMGYFDDQLEDEQIDQLYDQLRVSIRSL